MKRWRCSVCGYIHAGEAPPDQCPVCGADGSRFVPVEDEDDPLAAAASTAHESTVPPAAQQWQCAVCGYSHEGATPPDPCPVCGSEARHFKPADEPSISETLSNTGVQDDRTGADDRRWRCSVCGYIHTGPAPPQNCPVCGADKSRFVLLDAPDDEAQPQVEETAPEQTPSPVDHAPAFWQPYRRWIDFTIEYHAHPIAVHIPNGVVPITVAMVFLAAIFDWPAIGHAAVYNMGFVLLSMPVVLLTGYLHWQFKFGGNMTGLFKWKIICGATVLALSLILFLWGLVSPNAARHPGAVYLLLHVLMLAVAGIAGWLGGKLVFRPWT